MVRRDVPLEIGVRELRDNLRKWLDAVRDGRSITITERGKPVARLVTVGSSSVIDRLIAEGLIRPPKRPKIGADAIPKIRARGSISARVKEQRR